MTARLRSVLAACLLFGACAPGDAFLGPPRAGDPLPPLETTSLSGQAVVTDSYQGRALVLNLWATWCPPCRAEMPYLQELSEEYGDRGLSVVGISVDGSGARDLLERFLEEAGVRYDILLDPAMVSMDELGILGLPATFLVDASGTISHVRTGPIMEGDESFIAELEAILPGTGGETAAQPAAGTTASGAALR